MVFLQLHRYPQGTDLRPAGNWHRASNLQPPCQFPVSCLSKLSGITDWNPKGRTDVAIYTLLAAADKASGREEHELADMRI